MTIAGALSLLLVVFGTAAMALGAWIAVRWASKKWPNGSADVRLGPFASLQEAVARQGDKLRDLEQTTQLLRSEAQLLRTEWEDSFQKMRRAEERLKKARQRAETLTDEVEAGTLPLLREDVPGFHPELPLAAEPLPTPPPAESSAMQRFRRKFG